MKLYLTVCLQGDVRQLPGEADFDSLFALAKVANLKVIYCLRLHNGDPQLSAQTAKYISDHYAAQLDCFSIGQKPSAYPADKKDTRDSQVIYKYSKNSKTRLCRKEQLCRSKSAAWNEAKQIGSNPCGSGFFEANTSP